MNFRQVHLDFHTSEKIPEVGSRFDKKQFQAALKAGHVNSITVFAKCHHGWAYFPSEANEIHPTLNGRDLLREQVEACHEIGVRAPIYISAGLDEKYAVRHHDQVVRNANCSTTWATSFNQPGYHKLCMNSPYLPYLLEQVREVCRKYADVGIDGLFFDIVGVQPCCCQYCIQTLRDEGKDPFDEKNVMELAERTYANYAKSIRATVDEFDPSIYVFHNGGNIRRGRRDIAFYNTHLELESLPTGGWGYDHFPLSARYVQQFGMDFLGMTGKFHFSWGEFGGFKHPNALRYECALSAAMGAKCSIGDQLHPTGSVDMATYELIGAGYAELEQKEPWCDGVSAVADVGVLSCDAVGEFVGRPLENASFICDVGATRALLEGHYLFNILDMDSDFSAYKVIILPDRIPYHPAIKEKLDAFLARGGKLLATGDSGLDEAGGFAFDFGGIHEGETVENPTYLRPLYKEANVADSAYVVYDSAHIVRENGGKAYAMVEKSYFNRTSEHFCSHRHTPNSGEYAGVGMIEGKDGIYISWKAFTGYATQAPLILKKLLHKALDILLGDAKTVVTDLPAQGVTTVMEQKAENRYVHHLLYASPVKRGNGKHVVEVIEDLIPLYNVNVTLRLPRTPKKVYLAPSMEPLAYTANGNEISYTLPKLDCHQMVVLDY